MNKFVENFDLIIRSIQNHDKKKKSKFDINPPHLIFLNYIKMHELVTASELANNFTMTIGGAMHILDDLLKKDLIEKNVLEDKRKKSYKITKKGEEMCDAILKCHTDFKSELFDYLGDEDSLEFLRILNRIKEFIEVKRNE